MTATFQITLYRSYSDGEQRYLAHQTINATAKQAAAFGRSWAKQYPLKAGTKIFSKVAVLAR
jgi:hypothetical protein